MCTSLKIAVMAEREVTPRKRIVGHSPVGGPAAKPPDGFGGLASMSSRRSPATPKGVPSEAYLKRLLSEGAEQLAALLD